MHPFSPPGFFLRRIYRFGLAAPSLRHADAHGPLMNCLLAIGPAAAVLTERTEVERSSCVREAQVTGALHIAAIKARCKTVDTGS